MVKVVLQGATEIEEHIEKQFAKRDTLIRVYYGDIVFSQSFTVINSVQPHHNLDDIDDGFAENLSNNDWDQRVEALTLFGETIEAADSEGGLYSLHQTFPVTDPAALTGTYQKDRLILNAGGPWSLELHRLSEPLRHRTHNLIEQATVREHRDDYGTW